MIIWGAQKWIGAQRWKRGFQGVVSTQESNMESNDDGTSGCGPMETARLGFLHMSI